MYDLKVGAIEEGLEVSSPSDVNAHWNCYAHDEPCKLIEAWYVIPIDRVGNYVDCLRGHAVVHAVRPLDVTVMCQVGEVLLLFCAVPTENRAITIEYDCVEQVLKLKVASLQPRRTESAKLKRQSILLLAHPLPVRGLPHQLSPLS